jgi:hypothetical protein
MLNEKAVRKELEKIRAMSRVTNGIEPLNGIEQTLMWVLGEPEMMSPSVYVDPYGTLRD